MNIFCIRPKGFNIGNDAIFIAMKHFIKKAFGFMPNIITLPATSKYETHNRAGLTAKTIYEINQYGSGVIVGGGNLYENNELDVDLNVLNALEVPLFLFSLSRGKIYNRFGEMVDRTDVMPDNKLLRLNEKAFLSYARDKVTQDYIKALGIGSVGLSACPTIFLEKVEPMLPVLSKQEKDLTLISIRHPDLMSIPLKKQAEMKVFIQNLLQHCRKEGHRVKLLCHDHRDVSFAAGFGDMEYIYIEDIYIYLALLKACRLNITFRLHSALPCFAFNRPAIKISYDNRALSLMDTIGYREWNINMMDSPNLLDDVKDRMANLQKLEQIHKSSKKLWASYYETISGAFKRFAGESLKFQ